MNLSTAPVRSLQRRDEHFGSEARFCAEGAASMFMNQISREMSTIQYIRPSLRFCIQLRARQLALGHFDIRRSIEHQAKGY